VDVEIRERKFTLRSEYEISTTATEWFARKSFFSFNDKIQLQTKDGNVLARIRGYFSPFRNKHDFELSDGRLYRFWCRKLWKGVFICEGNNEQFTLYRHKGLKWSIFLGEQQIAAVTKNRVVIGKGNEYKITMNRDADPTVMVCLVLTVNSEEDDDDDSTVTYDFGNIGPEDRRFDASWEPS
jgi:hypothetical protein